MYVLGHSQDFPDIVKRTEALATFLTVQRISQYISDLRRRYGISATLNKQTTEYIITLRKLVPYKHVGRANYIFRSP